MVVSAAVARRQSLGGDRAAGMAQSWQIVATERGGGRPLKANDPQAIFGGAMRRAVHAGTAVLCLLACAGPRWAVATGASAGADHAATPARAGEGAGRPAIWRTYDMIVSFQKLPRTYTCDQLWYEFRGILLRFGAPAAGINILPYDCSPTPTGDLKSPHVEVRFQLPFVLQPGITGAPIQAVERAVTLSPGQPKTLKASDCQLLEQIEQTMLASMPVQVESARFHCSAAPRLAGRFAVTVRVPVVAGAGSVAAAGTPSAGSAPR
jgi:hypothetical protein